MSKIGFFGGCFNPVTNIHIKIANKLIEDKKIDKVIFVPMNDFFKKNDLIEAMHRYNMLKLATKDFQKLDVDDIEIKENRKLCAVDAFEIIEESHFAEKCCKRDLFMIMGSDNYEKMPTWKDYNKIKDKYNYIVIERDKSEISSTQIREMIRSNDKRVKEYLPKEVYQYIIENELYKL